MSTAVLMSPYPMANPGGIERGGVQGTQGAGNGVGLSRSTALKYPQERFLDRFRVVSGPGAFAGSTPQIRLSNLHNFFPKDKKRAQAVATLDQ